MSASTRMAQPACNPSNELHLKSRSDLTATQAEELAAQFRISDTDESGTIDEREFRALLTRMGLQISAAEIDALVANIDANGDGLLDYAEVVQMIIQLQSGNVKFKALEKLLDALNTTPLALLEREAARYNLQVEYLLLNDNEEDAASIDQLSERFQMQLELVGKVCGPAGRDSIKATGATIREAKFNAAKIALKKIQNLPPGLVGPPGELPEQWEKWLFDNIERGASLKKLMQTLVKKGFRLTTNLAIMQKISTRASSYRLRTKRNAPSSIYGTESTKSYVLNSSDTPNLESPGTSPRTKRNISKVEKLPSSTVQVLHPQWAFWCQQELDRGIDGTFVLNELVAQGFNSKKNPLFTQRLLRTFKSRDDCCSNGATSLCTTVSKPFSFLHVLEQGILHEIELFVFGGQDVNASLLDVATNLKQSPLHIACKNGFGSIAKLLLKHGAHVDQLDSFHRTPLMVAARSGHSETAALLLENNADIYQLDNLKNSGLHWAAFSGSSTITSQLLRAHDDAFRLFITNLPQRRGVCYKQLLQNAYEITMDNKLQENETRRYHYTWLFESVQWLHKEILNEKSDDSRFCKMPAPQKPFMDYLILQYHSKLLNSGIREADGNENKRDSNRKQARHCKEGNLADWLSLSEMGFFLDTYLRDVYKHQANLQGRTALHLACDENLVCTHERVIQCLAERHGSSPFSLDHSSQTPIQLLLACRGRPGSPKGDAKMECSILQQRIKRGHTNKENRDKKRLTLRRKAWLEEINRVAKEFNKPETLNRMHKHVQEKNSMAVAHGAVWIVHKEPQSQNTVFEHIQSGFVQRQVPAQLVEEGRTQLGWKEKMGMNARFTERNQLHPEWELYCINGTDINFFFNRDTKICQWVLPEGLSVQDWRTKRIFESAEQLKDESDQASLTIQFSGFASAAIVEDAVKGRMLGSWRECVGFGGITFYLNTLDNRIFVEKPEEVLLHESYRYAHVLISDRSEVIEVHDRGWHHYHDPQTSYTYYYNELSGDWVDDTTVTKAFLDQIRLPKLQEKAVTSIEELRRHQEEEEWKLALQRARKHDRDSQIASEVNLKASAQQHQEDEELESTLRHLKASVTMEHLSTQYDDFHAEAKSYQNLYEKHTIEDGKNTRCRSPTYVDTRFRQERKVYIWARKNNLLTSIDPARKDTWLVSKRSEEIEDDLNVAELENARLEDTDDKPAIRERRRVSRILTRTEERFRLGLALCRWGCEVWLPRGLTLERHECAECPRRLMICRLGCSQIMEHQQWREVIYDHESENNEQCSHRIVFCPRECGVWLPHFELEESHFKNLCVKRPAGNLHCRLGCGQVYRGGSNELLTLEQIRIAHEEDDCELRKVKCTWPKCDAMILANERKNHRRAHLLSSGISNFVTAAVHEYKVPRDVKQLKLQAWGAGGGSGLLRNHFVGHGGGGAFVEGICPVYSGEILYFSIGSGGAGGKFARMVEQPDDERYDFQIGEKSKKVPGGVLVSAQVSTAMGGHPGGGCGHSGNKESACGGGGGFTIAGGGGGGGTCRSGGGGGTRDGKLSQAGDDIRCGRPGENAAGGAAGMCDEYNPICKFVGKNGSSMLGGDGAEFGGGGGGGLFGGGGGGFSPGIAGGGGGGSSYVNTDLLVAKSIRVESGKVISPGGMNENPPQSVRDAYWDVVDGSVGQGGTGSTRETACGNHGGVRIARPGFFDDMKRHR
ncbi:putative EF-hand domain pair, double-stranded RNA-binding domain, ankyrin repeat-containing [Plasmopara halstedii]